MTKLPVAIAFRNFPNAPKIYVHLTHVFVFGLDLTTRVYVFGLDLTDAFMCLVLISEETIIIPLYTIN
jgi:hypothetical protein